MPSFASGMSPFQSDIVTPVTSHPLSLSNSAVIVESTPPDIPTTTRSPFFGCSSSVYFILSFSAPTIPESGKCFNRHKKVTIAVTHTREYTVCTMEHNMILSASGWRKVFAESGNQEDKSPEIGKTNTLLCALIAESFAQYLTGKTGIDSPTIAVGTDTRPTGEKIARVIIQTLLHCGIGVQYLGISSAPEIMAYSRSLDGFLYISASHNPVGHNGIKFGLNDGGVIPGSEATVLAQSFTAKCASVNAEEHAEPQGTGQDA